jgi:hypothetical protein
MQTFVNYYIDFETNRLYRLYSSQTLDKKIRVGVFRRKSEYIASENRNPGIFGLKINHDNIVNMMDPLQHKHQALNHRLSQPRTQGPGYEVAAFLAENRATWKYQDFVGITLD